MTYYVTDMVNRLLLKHFDFYVGTIDVIIAQNRLWKSTHNKASSKQMILLRFI